MNSALCVMSREAATSSGGGGGDRRPGSKVRDNLDHPLRPSGSTLRRRAAERRDWLTLASSGLRVILFLRRRPPRPVQAREADRMSALWSFSGGGDRIIRFTSLGVNMTPCFSVCPPSGFIVTAVADGKAPSLPPAPPWVNRAPSRQRARRLPPPMIVWKKIHAIKIVCHEFLLTYFRT